MDTNPVEYWNAQARDYDDNIFSTIDEDHTGIITRTLDRCAAPDEEGPMGRCIDLGCGAGKYLSALAARFRSVSGYDLSPKLVGLSKKEAKSRGLQNVAVQVRDLAQVWYREDGSSLGDRHEMESYGFAVMANVLIAPVEDPARQLMLRNAFRSLCPGGRLLVVVPSLESALYVNMRCCEENFEGSSEILKRPTRAEGADVVSGILRRSGVRTKHYLEPEFRLLAGRVGFAVEACEKVLYAWHSELGVETDIRVPSGMKDTPLPWDWLFLLRRGAVQLTSSADASLRAVPAIDLDLGDRPGHVPAAGAPSSSGAERPVGGLAAAPTLPVMGAGPYSSRGRPAAALQRAAPAVPAQPRPSDETSPLWAAAATPGVRGGSSSDASAAPVRTALLGATTATSASAAAAGSDPAGDTQHPAGPGGADERGDGVRASTARGPPALRQTPSSELWEDIPRPPPRAMSASRRRPAL